MEYVKLGNTGLDVSRICLGGMSFGIGERGDFPWALNEERSRPMIRKALDVGINFLILRTSTRAERVKKSLDGS